MVSPLGLNKDMILHLTKRISAAHGDTSMQHMSIYAGSKVTTAEMFDPDLPPYRLHAFQPRTATPVKESELTSLSAVSNFLS